MDSTLAANLLLAATIAVFVLLTLIAFLLTDGKPIFLEPFKRRMEDRFGDTSIRNIIVDRLKKRRDGGRRDEREDESVDDGDGDEPL